MLARRRRPWAVVAAPLVALAVLGGLTLGRDSAAIFPQPPTQGQVLVQVVAPGGTSRTVTSFGAERAIPIGSVAKVMTAYLVLRQHPLTASETGPELSVDAAAVADYKSRIASGQSLMKVYDGERISLRKALEAALIPSANNIANLMARWQSGDVDTFVRQMNTAAAALGMRHTHYADPNGFDPRTVSTAADQVVLAQAAMRQPALADIVAKRTVDLPGEGTVTNYNRLLGRQGVIGLKTGSTDQSGGNLVFVARQRVDGHEVWVVGAVFGQLIGRPTAESLPVTFAVARYEIARAKKHVDSAYLAGAAH